MTTLLTAKPADVHWNYFLSLEADLIHLSRYVEFREENYKTFSIEIARLLMTAAAETEVVCKHLCEKLAPESVGSRDHMDDYRAIIVSKKPNFARFKVSMPIYGIELQPWINWSSNPAAPTKWWNAYNGVKHHRHTKYEEATLENLLDAMAGLFVAWLHYLEATINPSYGTIALEPDSKVFTLFQDYQERRMWSTAGYSYNVSRAISDPPEIPIQMENGMIVMGGNKTS